MERDVSVERDMEDEDPGEMVMFSVSRTSEERQEAFGVEWREPVTQYGLLDVLKRLF